MINQVVSNSVQNRAFSEFSQPKNGWYIDTSSKQHEEKRKRHYGTTIAVAAMAVGFGIMALMKGALPKKATKFLTKLKANLENKVEKNSTLSGFYKKSIQTIDSFLEKSQSINNITSLKDIIFRKFMFGTQVTKDIHVGITNFFKNMSRKTVNSSYAKTNKKFAELHEYMYSLNQKLSGQNASNINSINEKFSKINELYNSGFDSSARVQRLAKIDDATKDLFDYMWNASYSDIKNFRSKDMYQTFIAEAKMRPFKESISKEVLQKKQGLYSSIEQVLAEYKKVLSEGEYKKLEAKVNVLKKSLEKSVENETTNYIDKARDLKLGSAPTDVLSILGSVGAVGWYLGKSDNKDEKISASLKYGIPAIGAIATSLICTAKLIAGTKSLAIGLVSGWLMSKIGSQVDYLRKQYSLDISLQNKQVVKPQPDKVSQK